MPERDSIDHLPERLQNAIRDLEEFEKTCVNSDMRWQALNREMWIRDQIGMFNLSKNNFEAAYEEGYRLGYDKEIKRIAKNLKEMDYSPEFISQVTELDVETINKL